MPNGEYSLASHATGVTAFLGRTTKGPANEPTLVKDYAEFETHFGMPLAEVPMASAVRDFFRNGGAEALIVRLLKDSGTVPGADGRDLGPLEPDDYHPGLAVLDADQNFDLMCLLPDGNEVNPEASAIAKALALCAERSAFLLIDAPLQWTAATIKMIRPEDFAREIGVNIDDPNAGHAAVYYPRLVHQVGETSVTSPASGAVAGLMAKSDANRGVWRAAAGEDATVLGVTGLTQSVDDRTNQYLNSIGVICLRNFPDKGTMVWGARTLRGGDGITDDFKYIPTRRLANFIEQTLLQGMEWTAFEPNGERLWKEIRKEIEGFMGGLFKQGAFAGTKARDSFQVKCDKSNNGPQELKDNAVNVAVGFAPIKAGELVWIQVELLAGDP